VVCPAIGSIAGMPILVPLLVILLVALGVTHTPERIAAMNHAPITVCVAMCTLPAVRTVSLCVLQVCIQSCWRSLSLSLIHIHTHTHNSRSTTWWTSQGSLSLSRTLTYTRVYTHTYTHTYFIISNAHTHTHTHTHIPVHQLRDGHVIGVSLAHTHTHTHIHTHTLLSPRLGATHALGRHARIRSTNNAATLSSNCSNSG